MAPSSDKDALTADLADARTRAKANLRALAYDLELLPRLKSNISRNPLAWFSAAVIIGLLLSKFAPSRRHRVEWSAPQRKPDTAEQAGKAALVLTALKFAFDFAKPMIFRYLTQRLSIFTERSDRGR